MSYLSSQINSYSCKRHQPNMVFGQLVAHSNTRSSGHGFPEVKTLNPLPANRLQWERERVGSCLPQLGSLLWWYVIYWQHHLSWRHTDWLAISLSTFTFNHFTFWFETLRAWWRLFSLAGVRSRYLVWLLADVLLALLLLWWETNEQSVDLNDWHDL